MENAKPLKFIFSNKILLCIEVFFLLVISWLVFISKDLRFDTAIQSAFHSIITQPRTDFMQVITFLGNHQFLVPAYLALIGFFLLTKKRKDALIVTITAFSSLGLMSLLKNIFRRHRPDNPLVEGITNYSFPSGHALMSIVFFGLLLFFITNSSMKKWHQNIIILLVCMLILTIGVSRVYLNVHFATDVMAGWLLGCLWLTVILTLLEKIIYKKPISYN